MNSIKEKYIKLYPGPVSLQVTEQILEQMKKTICEICLRDEGIKGSGFFCKIPFQNNNNNFITVLITSNHIINEELLNKNEEIITLIINKESKEIKLDQRIKYTNEEYDITIIEIKKMIKFIIT